MVFRCGISFDSLTSMWRSEIHSFGTAKQSCNLADIKGWIGHGTSLGLRVETPGFGVRVRVYAIQAG